jgi:hypothetical protein
MDWQLLVVVGAVAAATGYVLRAAWRTWFAAGCASGCGGCAKATAPDGESRRIPLTQI